MPFVQGLSSIQGSIYGGLALTLNGNGFTSNTSVVLGNATCSVVHASLSQLSCMTSKNYAGLKNLTIKQVLILEIFELVSFF
jgi:hypothetical protein